MAGFVNEMLIDTHEHPEAAWNCDEYADVHTTRCHLEHCDYWGNGRAVQKKGGNDARNCLNPKRFQKTIADAIAAVEMYGYENYLFIIACNPEDILSADGKFSRNWRYRAPVSVLQSNYFKLASVCQCRWAGSDTEGEKLAHDFLCNNVEDDAEAMAYRAMMSDDE